MDIATVLGMLGAFAMVAWAIENQNQWSQFNDWFSPVFVIGATFLGVMIRFSLGHFVSSLAVLAHTFKNSNDDPQEIIDEIVNLATVSRKDGVLALEKVPISEPFLEEGVRMLIDGSNAEVLKQSMSKNMRGAIERNAASQKVWRSMGESSPAFGMIGTVIGLVSMMANMDDPKAIGPAMALALLTTLYGVVFAQVVFLPVADKLKYRSSAEQLKLTMCIDGIMAIQAGQNPRVIASVLSSYLDPTKRVGDTPKGAK